MKNRVAIAVAGILLTDTVFAQAPQWWIDRGIINSNAIQNDYAPVNQGQVKNMAVQAMEEFNAALTFGAGNNINQLVGGFTTNLNYAPANIGQLKAVAAPFYDLLNTLGVTNARPAGMLSGPYPWSSATNSANDYALANIGQLKYLFSFDTAVLSSDADEDGLPDWWEHLYFGTATGSVANEDTESDGLSNLGEYQTGHNPFNGDTDTNGVPDAIEVGIHETTGVDGVLIQLPGSEYRHVVESSLQMKDYGAYGAE